MRIAPATRRTLYDRGEAANRIRATRYPQAEEFAATSVLAPPAAEDTLAACTLLAEP